MGFMGRLFSKKPEPTDFSPVHLPTSNPGNHFGVTNPENWNEYNDHKKRAEYNRLLKQDNPVTAITTTSTVPAPLPITRILAQNIYRVKYGPHLLTVNAVDGGWTKYTEPKTANAMFHITGEHEDSRVVMTFPFTDAPLNKLKELEYQRFRGILAENIESPVGQVTQLSVLPCLQELKKGDVMGAKKMSNYYTTEQEQEPGEWDPIEYKTTHLKSRTSAGVGGSTLFNQYWVSGIPKAVVTRINKHGLLTIPNEYTKSFTTCKELTRVKKWEMYTKYCIKDKVDKVENVLILTTHHNRMRDASKGILPFKYSSLYSKLIGKQRAYANLCMIRISFIKDGNTIRFDKQVMQKGFPDKGSFESMTPKDPYIYIKDAKDIDFTDVEKGIEQGLTGIETITGHILVVRHANAGHNKPTNEKDQNKRLDSILTPLGMTQALCSGSYGFECTFNNTPYTSLGHFLKNKKIIPACSFLQRTQLTCMLMMQGEGVVLSKTMLRSLRYMMNQAQIRFNAMNTPFESFDTYSPLSDASCPDYVKELFKKIKRECELQTAIRNKQLGDYLEKLEFGPYLNNAILDSDLINHEVKFIDSLNKFLSEHKIAIERSEANETVSMMKQEKILGGRSNRSKHRIRKRMTHKRITRKYRS
jgi:hypothetical protein